MEKQNKIVLKMYKKKKIKTTAHSQNILHGLFFSIKRKKYKKKSWCRICICQFTFDRMSMVMIFLIELVIFCFICDYCNKEGRLFHCLFSHKMYFNASKLFQKWKKLPNVCHIYNVLKFRGTQCTFTTFPS